MQTLVKMTNHQQKGAWKSFPLHVNCEGTEFDFWLEQPISSDWHDFIQSHGKQRKGCEFSFFSSQEGFVFERIHEMLDAYIPDLSVKVDPLLREFVKNAEKQNIVVLAMEMEMISHCETHLPMDLMGKILQEKVLVEPKGIPLLYHDPSLLVKIVMKIEGNDLRVEITNKGALDQVKQGIIARKIELGKMLAHFDLRQEFEMKTYGDAKKTIEDFLAYEYEPAEQERLWPFAFDDSFDDYWMMSPYFLLIGSGTHVSFFPYYATAHGQLRVAQKQAHNVEEGHYSAGMGYIQSAFIIESNRSLYGTDGRVFTPFQQDGHVVAGFCIGFPRIEINFPA